MTIDEVVTGVRSIDLPIGHFAIFGSGPLLVRGIISSINDVDILARGPAWELARSRGDLVALPEHGVSVVSLHGGSITIGTRWAIGEVDIDLAIDSADLIAELPWVRLDFVAAYKRVAARPKDLEHLRLLERWLDRKRG